MEKPFSLDQKKIYKVFAALCLGNTAKSGKQNFLLSRIHHFLESNL